MNFTHLETTEFENTEKTQLEFVTDMSFILP
jgi:hypothetical protein